MFSWVILVIAVYYINANILFHISDLFWRLILTHFKLVQWKIANKVWMTFPDHRGPSKPVAVGPVCQILPKFQQLLLLLVLTVRWWNGYILYLQSISNPIYFNNLFKSRAALMKLKMHLLPEILTKVNGIANIYPVILSPSSLMLLHPHHILKSINLHETRSDWPSLSLTLWFLKARAMSQRKRIWIYREPSRKWSTLMKYCRKWSAERKKSSVKGKNCKRDSGETFW